MYILDTNVVSELVRPVANERVAGWARGVRRRFRFITAVTASELLLGVQMKEPGRRRSELDATVARTLYDDFAGRILPFDFAAADVYAVISAERRRAGRPVAEADLQIASIALDRGATIVTRNTRHFTGYGLDVLDPWSA